ncbi:MAG: SdiA-regulated domain-containing protein [Chitinophagaceae bacterium]
MSLFEQRFLVVYSILLFCACGDGPVKETERPPVAEKINTAAAEYDFSKPLIIKLKKKLKEISGIFYLADNQFASIEDESGTIFLLDYTTGMVTNTIDFAGNGDYEDIVADDNYYYVLESSGIIFRVARNATSPVEKYELPRKKSREFESIFLEKEKGKLIMLCKECKHKDDLKEGYCLDLKSFDFNKQPCFSLDFTSLENALPSGTVLKPSAAAINPSDQKLYVLCSVGKTLLRCTRDGKIEKVFPLDQNTFRQPEGLTFLPNGDMYISNEAAGEQATLVKISYLQQPK